MLDVVWLNIVELSKHEPFTALLDKVSMLNTYQLQLYC